MNGYTGTDTTVLEDLPRGGGQIQLPTGEVQHFQFTPPSPSDAAEALRAAAARQQQFEFAQGTAQRQAEAEEDYRQLAESMALKANAQKAMNAMERTIAAGMFQKEVQAALNAGMNQQDATVRALSLWGGHLFAGDPQASQRAVQFAVGTRFQRTPAGGYVATSPTGTPMRLPNEALEQARLAETQAQTKLTEARTEELRSGHKDEPKAMQELADWEKERAYLTTQLQLIVGLTPEQQAAILKKLDQVDGKISDLRKQHFRTGSLSSSSKGVSGTIVPLPKSKADLEVGVLYQTSKGVARWTGKQFEKVVD